MQVAEYADVVVLRPEGRLDQDSTPAFQDHLLTIVEQADATAVVLDMSEVDYISSVGLRALMMGAKIMKRKQSALVAAALTSVVQEIFEISKFSFVISVFANVQDAIAANSEGALKAYDDGSGG